MEIIDRKQAIADGRTKYFTGEACRNGHVAYRYTQSGTCADCIRSSAATRAIKPETVERNAGMLAIAMRRREALDCCVEFETRCYPQDFAGLRALAELFLVQRFPFLSASDAVVRGTGRGGSGDTVLYKLRAHAEDHRVLKTVENNLLNAHGPDVSHIKHHAAAERDRLLAGDVCPVPEFKP